MAYLFQGLDPSVPLVWFGCSEEQTFIVDETQAEGQKVLLKTCRWNQDNHKDTITMATQQTHYYQSYGTQNVLLELLVDT